MIPTVLKFNETRLRNQFFLPSIEIDDEDNYSIFCKRAFSDFLDGITGKRFFGGKPPDSHFTMKCL